MKKKVARSPYLAQGPGRFTKKARPKLLIESIEDGIVLIDPKEIVTHINELPPSSWEVERE